MFYSGKDYTSFLWGQNQGQAFSSGNPAFQTFPNFAPSFQTIDQPAGGKLLATILSGLEQHPNARLWADELNREASRRYAETASGNVMVLNYEGTSPRALKWADSATLDQLSDSEKRKHTRDEHGPTFNLQRTEERTEDRLRHGGKSFLVPDPQSSTWFDVEFRTLLKNPKVTSLNGIPKDQINSFLEKNNWSTEALLRVDKDLFDGLIKNKPFNRHDEGPPSGFGGPPNQDLNSIRSNPSGIFGKLSEGDKGLNGVAYQSKLGSFAEATSLFMRHAVLPGGIVPGSEMSVNIGVRSFAIDPARPGEITVNGEKLCTGLTNEEILLVAGAALANLPLSAVSSTATQGTHAFNIVGATMRLADVAIGEFVFGTDKAPLFFGEKYRSSQLPLEKLLADLQNGTSKDVTRALNRVLKQDNLSVVLEFKGFALESTKKKGLGLASVQSSLHLVSFDGSSQQPRLFGGFDKVEESDPATALRAKRLIEDNGKALREHPLIQRVSQYFLVYSLIRSALAQRGQIVGIGDLRHIANNRTVVNFDEKQRAPLPVEVQKRLREGFFVILEKIKKEASFAGFTRLVGVAFLYAHYVQERALMVSLEEECRLKIVEVTPPKNDPDSESRRLRFLVAALAERSFRNQYPEECDRRYLQGAELSVVSFAALLRQALKKSDIATALGLLQSLPIAFRGVGKEAENLQTTSTSIFNSVRHIDELGFASEAMCRIVQALSNELIASPGFSVVANWESVAALGYFVKTAMGPRFSMDLFLGALDTVRSLEPRERHLVGYILGSIAKKTCTDSLSGDFDTLDAFIKVSESVVIDTFDERAKEVLSDAKFVIKRSVDLASECSKRSNSEPVTGKRPGWQTEGMIGLDRLELEARHIRSDNTTALKQAYIKLVKRIADEAKSETTSTDVFSSMLRSLYVDPKEPFKVGEVSLLSDALTKKVLDCDTSAYIVFDALKLIGKVPQLVRAPGHLFLECDGFYLESVQGAVLNKRDFDSRYGGEAVIGDSPEFAAGISCTEMYHYINEFFERDKKRFFEQEGPSLLDVKKQLVSILVEAIGFQPEEKWLYAVCWIHLSKEERREDSPVTRLIRSKIADELLTEIEKLVSEIAPAEAAIDWSNVSSKSISCCPLLRRRTVQRIGLGEAKTGDLLRANLDSLYVRTELLKSVSQGRPSREVDQPDTEMKYSFSLQDFEPSVDKVMEIERFGMLAPVNQTLAARERDCGSVPPYYETSLRYWIQPTHGGALKKRSTERYLAAYHKDAVSDFRLLLDRFPGKSEQEKLLLLSSLEILGKIEEAGIVYDTLVKPILKPEFRPQFEADLARLREIGGRHIPALEGALKAYQEESPNAARLYEIAKSIAPNSPAVAGISALFDDQARTAMLKKKASAGNTQDLILRLQDAEDLRKIGKVSDAYKLISELEVPSSSPIFHSITRIRISVAGQLDRHEDFIKHCSSGLSACIVGEHDVLRGEYLNFRAREYLQLGQQDLAERDLKATRSDVQDPSSSYEPYGDDLPKQLDRISTEALLAIAKKDVAMALRLIDNGLAKDPLSDSLHFARKSAILSQFPALERWFK